MTHGNKRDLAREQALDPKVDVEFPRPEIDLPDVTYFCIAFFFAYIAVRSQFLPDELARGELPSSPQFWIILCIEVAVFTFLVWVPLVVAIARGAILATMRKDKVLLSTPPLFLLPPAFRTRHPWFVPIYYGSMIGSILMVLVLQAVRTIANR